jgi:hypothetical protein
MKIYHQTYQRRERLMDLEIAFQKDPNVVAPEDLKIKHVRSYFRITDCHKVLRCNFCQIPVNRDGNAAANMVTKALILLQGLELPRHF